MTQTTLCGPTRTTGTVRNDGGSSATGASVVARLLTTDGTLVTIAEARTAPGTIAAGGTASFEAAYRIDVCDSVVLMRGGLQSSGYKGDIAVNWAEGRRRLSPLC